MSDTITLVTRRRVNGGFERFTMDSTKGESAKITDALVELTLDGGDRVVIFPTHALVGATARQGAALSEAETADFANVS